MEHATPFVLLLIALFIGPVLYFIWHAKRGSTLFVRRIPGIDAIDEAIGRSVELGRPMAFTTGLTDISPELYACLGVLRHVSQKAAIYRSKLLVPSTVAESMVLADATIQSAYRSQRRFSDYDPRSVRFLSTDQFAFASGYMGLVHREQVAGAFLFGRFAAESLILAEAGQQIGAIQVAATISNEQIPFFITTCDYTLIGEELFAAGAYLSKNPVQTGSLRGQDIAKLIIVVLIVVGILQATISAVQGGEPHAALGDWFSVSWSELLSSSGK
ncbi:MAG: hypothetical protein KDD44_01825 [Bdellovibrionales bacterium]|nr:hypothetical protein [Bdellovibrionales bacterium]